MAKQKPPDPFGKTTEFPYQLFWEEFGPEWEKLLEYDATSPIDFYEALRKRLAPQSRLAIGLDRSKIRQLVDEAGLIIGNPDELTETLFQTGMVYQMPAMRRELGLSSIEVKEHVEAIARNAHALLSKLQQLDINFLRILLGNQMVDRRQKQGIADGEKARIEESIEDLLRTLSDLAGGAEIFAEEAPVMAQGSSVKLLQERYIRDAANEIRAASGYLFDIKVSDGVSRTYRAANEATELLYDYIRLVDAQLGRGTIHRVLKANAMLRIRRGRPPAKSSAAARE